MPAYRCAVAVALFGLMLAGCAAVGGTVLGPRERAYPHEVPIPPGHMPPPGECRVWFPNREAGAQPPPGACDDLRYRVPPGAILIRG